MFIFSIQPVSGQWINISSNPQHYFKDLRFCTKEVGHALLIDTSNYETHFYGTMNEGTLWSRFQLDTSIFNKFSLSDQFFTSPSTGYLSCWPNTGTNHTPFLFKTTDGGQNWTDVSPANGPNQGTYEIYFIDSLKGFVFSDAVIYRTTDGGTNWTHDTMGTLYDFITEIEFSDANHGIAIGSSGAFRHQGKMYTTDDGGLSWDTTHLNPIIHGLNFVEFTNNQTAYTNAFYSDDHIYKSVDNGQTWDTLIISSFTGTFKTIQGMHFENDTIGYIIAYAEIYKTIDGGLNWTLDYKNNTQTLQCIASNSSSIFVGGPIDTLLKHELAVGIPILDPIDKLNFYLNPLSQDHEFNFSKQMSGLLQIFDVSGIEVVSKQLFENESVDLSEFSLKPGLHLLTIDGVVVGSGKLMVR